MFDLVIIGGGPAGIAAGIQASHMGLKIRILEKNAWGGRLSLARKVENVPGLACPLSGKQVVETLLEQARNKRLSMALDPCESIDYENGCFVVRAISNKYLARTVILATGVQPKGFSVKGLDDDHSCLFYSWLDVPIIREMRIAIVGGGEAAFDQACSLAERGAEVVMVIRGNRPKAFDGLVDEARNLGVEIILNASIERAESKADHILIELSHPHDTQLEVKYILASVGVIPSEITATNAATERTNRGLYHAGDVSSQNYRQAAIAFGDGVKKAMIVYEYLKGYGRHGNPHENR